MTVADYCNETELDGAFLSGHAQGRLDGIAECVELLASAEAGVVHGRLEWDDLRMTPKGWADWVEARMKEKGK